MICSHLGLLSHLLVLQLNCKQSVFFQNIKYSANFVSERRKEELKGTHLGIKNVVQFDVELKIQCLQKYKWNKKDHTNMFVERVKKARSGLYQNYRPHYLVCNHELL